jgi:hypothetical protein
MNRWGVSQTTLQYKEINTALLHTHDSKYSELSSDTRIQGEGETGNGEDGEEGEEVHEKKFS